MATMTISGARVRQAVPFFGVTNMEASLRFYVDGLGFEMKNYWIPDAAKDKPDERIRWCWLQRDDAAIMLQEFLPEQQPQGTLGAGTSVYFMCEDALALYREFKSRGIQTRTRPFVGNRLWVVPPPRSGRLSPRVRKSDRRTRGKRVGRVEFSRRGSTRSLRC